MPWILLCFFALTSVSQARDTLAELEKARWQHRIILVHDVLKSPEWAAAVKKHAAGIKKRHLKFIPVDKALLKKYRITFNEPTLILIGKDGGEKARQSQKFDLKKIFKLIDQMPMRRREMAEQKP